MAKVRDAGVNLTCRDCGRQFLFTEGEQEFYERMGFNHPSRCRDCRSTKEKQNGHLNCTECGIKLQDGASVYCEQCLRSLQLAHVSCSQCGATQGADTLVYCATCFKKIQLDTERQIEKYKKAASAAESKLQAAESTNEEMQRALYEAKQRIAELELKAENLNQDLEKAYQFQVASGWLKPALEDIAERLKALEQAERETGTSLTAAIHKVQVICRNTSLWQVMKRSLKLGRSRD
jgi:predicted amidophosphoribosyltransferase